ncbi:hypothetical protein FisN_15Hh356 [Fistulifera solaris]|uniref:Uncharacterized protein n=1 Tax=Fistulifera solaris TaxID=1519565 RepID=A0A1Z5JGH3_FISSO|nr:hypothetical protein FisN_15Hh356 [Fistulifera solaris]|eukprot:GAX12868.1 hypothetical protein FisN_15Hh356 [Fistulifera solaris]
MVCFLSVIRMLAFALVAVTQAQNENQAKAIFCAEWELNAKAFQAASAAWKEPPCYSFMYRDLSVFSDGSPYVTTVLNGVTEAEEACPIITTLQVVWDLIRNSCYFEEDCPFGYGSSCRVEYATTNETGLVYPAFFDISEYDIYRINNVHTMYTSYLSTPPFEFVQTVQNGTVLSAYGDESLGWFLPFATFADIWNEIDESCVRDCPTSGAACQIEYATEFESGIMYPSLLGINYAGEPGYEISYAISVMPCVDRKAGVCVDFEQVHNDFFATKYFWNTYLWAEISSCYTYIIRGTVDGATHGPFPVFVPIGLPTTVGAPMTDIEADMVVTFVDWLAEIEEHCIRACASNSTLEAYYNCTVLYDQEWNLPTYIVFDKDGAGDKYVYEISNITMDVCDAESWKSPANETPSIFPAIATSSGTGAPESIGAFLVVASLYSVS